MHDGRDILIDQGGENDRSHAVCFSLGVDTQQGFACLIGIVEEGDAYQLELDILELRQQTVSERFGGEPGAVGNEKNRAFDHAYLFGSERFAV